MSFPLSVGLLMWACGWPFAFLAVHAVPAPSEWSKDRDMKISAVVALFWPPIGFFVVIGMGLHAVAVLIWSAGKARR